MSLLVKEIIKNFLPEEENKRTVALYAGGFKPPTQGHFEVVETALKQNPEIDEFIIFIGHKERDGITQDESLLIWEIYNNYLPFKVKLEPTSLAPIKAIYDYSKNHPTQEVLWVIGAREGNEEDFKDINSRTRSITNYPNIEVRTIITKGGVSGTAARNASKVSFEKFEPFLPKQLTPEEKQEVYQIVSSNIKEQLNENASYSQHIDIKQKIKELTQHMLNKGMNIIPLPKVIFKHGDTKNAKQFLGKTAYYNPETMEIILYTEGRHPKDIVRSFSHEMVHHIQNIENRLGNVTTTNTQEDDYLNKLEQEANLVGTMTFRNWTDSLQEIKYNYPTTLTSLLSSQLYEMKVNEIKLNPENAVEIYGDLDNGDFTVGDYDYNYRIVNMEGNPYNSDSFYNISFSEVGNNKPDPSLPTGNARENYIKILSTMYKIILDFVENIKPEYIGISSLDDSGYWNIYNNLIKTNPLPGYSRKDAGLDFKNRDGKTGKFVVLKKNNIPESKSKDPFGLNAYAMELARLREEETQYTIYCDMDGVLVDFDRGYQELTGITTKHADAQGVDKFWEPLTKAGAAFWIKLKWMPDGKQLWDYIKKYNPELLSAPSREESSKLGKRVWVKRELPGVKLILRSAERKQEFANPTSILIDDREKNIKQWEAAGGIGILHTSAADTIKQLKQLGL